MEFVRLVCLFYFFFSSRRRHTRLQGDWSSDVCSSDLVAAAPETLDAPKSTGPVGCGASRVSGAAATGAGVTAPGCRGSCWTAEIGRAAGRERGWRTEGDGAATNEKEEG